MFSAVNNISNYSNQSFFRDFFHRREHEKQSFRREPANILKDAIAQHVII